MKKVTLINNNNVWNPQRRYKINQGVIYNGNIYQNKTGSNGNPESLVDWIIISSESGSGGSQDLEQTLLNGSNVSTPGAYISFDDNVGNAAYFDASEFSMITNSVESGISGNVDGGNFNSYLKLGYTDNHTNNYASTLIPNKVAGVNTEYILPPNTINNAQITLASTDDLNLQEVTDTGNTTSNSIFLDGNKATLTIRNEGNDRALIGDTGGEGWIRLDNDSGGGAELRVFENGSVVNLFQFPEDPTITTVQTLATTDMIPDVSGFVDTSTNQDIFGEKTLYSDTYFNNGSGGITLVNGNVVNVNDGSNSSNLNSSKLAIADAADNHIEVKADKISMWNESDNFNFDLVKSTLSGDIVVTSPTESGQLALKADLSLQTVMEGGSSWIKGDSSAFFSIDDPSVSGEGNFLIITDVNSFTVANTGFNITSNDSSGNRLIFSSLVPTTGDLTFNLPYTKSTGTYVLATIGDILDRVVTNSTTIALSSSTLNSSYPSATIGFKVQALSIIGGGMIYEKTATGWCQYLATIVT